MIWGAQIQSVIPKKLDTLMTRNLSAGGRARGLGFGAFGL